MQSYTVHPGVSGAREDVVFVADSWSWPALAFGPLWLVWHRQWLGLAGYLVIVALITGAGLALGLHPTAASALSLLLNAGLALEGHQIRRWRLESAGHPARAVVSARSLEDAETRYFSALPARLPEAPRTSVPAVAGPVLGVFPQPGGRF